MYFFIYSIAPLNRTPIKRPAIQDVPTKILHCKFRKNDKTGRYLLT